MVLSYKLIKKRKNLKFAIIPSLIILFLIIYWIYHSIYPNDSFYHKEFKDITGTEFPKTARFIDRDASYPDFHGKYSSSAIIELDNKDFIFLLETLKQNQKLNDTIIISSEQLNKMERNLRNKVVIQVFSKEMSRLYYLIQFYDDYKTIMIEKMKK